MDISKVVIITMLCLSPPCSGQSYSSSASPGGRHEDSRGVYRYVSGFGRVYLRCHDGRRDPVHDCRDSVRAAGSASGAFRPSYVLGSNRGYDSNYYYDGQGSYRVFGYRRRGASSSLSRYGVSSSVLRGRYGDPTCPANNDIYDGFYNGYGRSRYSRRGRLAEDLNPKSASLPDPPSSARAARLRDDDALAEGDKGKSVPVGNEVNVDSNGDAEVSEAHAINFSVGSWSARVARAEERGRRDRGKRQSEEGEETERQARHYPTSVIFRYDNYRPSGSGSVSGGSGYYDDPPTSGPSGGGGSYYDDGYGGGGGGSSYYEDSGYYDSRPPYQDDGYFYQPYLDQCREIGRECDYEAELSCEMGRALLSRVRPSTSSSSRPSLRPTFSGVRVRWIRIEPDGAGVFSARDRGSGSRRRFRDAMGYFGARARLSSSGNTLKISRLRPEDKGVYVCEIEDRGPSSSFRGDSRRRRVMAREIRFFPTYPCV